MVLYRLRAGGPLETLARLFLLGMEVSLREARRTLSTEAVEALAVTGLVETTADRLRPRALVIPSGEHLIAFDPPQRLLERRADYVLGPGPTARRLIDLAIRRPVASALDLGCGCGLLALFAAGYSDEVVAVDINPRAVAYTRLNAALNGVENIECRQGDLFAPVTGRRFDRILSNPPFVISPSADFVYRDGGVPVVRRIIDGAGAALSGGGHLQMLANWPHLAGRDWQADLSEWLRGRGCDAWVLYGEALDAAAYASRWLRQEQLARSVYRRRFAEWTAFYAREGIEALGEGLIVLRRSEASQPWVAIQSSPGAHGPCGESVLDALAARDLLAETASDPLALLRQPLRAPAGLETWTRRYLDGEHWRLARPEVRRSTGLTFSAGVDFLVAELVGRVDGRREIGTVAADLVEAGDLDREILDTELPEVLRRLLELALLVPAEPRVPPETTASRRDTPSGC